MARRQKETEINYYEILGVNPTATPAEIKAAYRKLVMMHHPDKYRDPKEQQRAEEYTKRLNCAYEILSNSNMRREHDEDLKHYAEAKERKRKADEEKKRRAEQARKDREKREREERERREKERLERERRAREKAEQERLEQEKRAREKAEQERLERERREREHAERERQREREKKSRDASSGREYSAPGTHASASKSSEQTTGSATHPVEAPFHLMKTGPGLLAVAASIALVIGIGLTLFGAVCIRVAVKMKNGSIPYAADIGQEQPYADNYAQSDRANTRYAPTVERGSRSQRGIDRSNEIDPEQARIFRERDKERERLSAIW
jgi:curved DNA-binding protein CbpA